MLDELPDARTSRTRAAAWPPDPPPPTGGLVVVVAAGTSDLPVAREAELTARYLGRRTELVVDVGVAGLHRVVGTPTCCARPGRSSSSPAWTARCPGWSRAWWRRRSSRCRRPSGYGAAFGGVAALLTMLNACAPGIGVVNIDNGYGAGHLAAQIAAP